MNINITVEKKHAKVVGAPVIICGNRGYNITFTLDSEWDNLPEKTARFSWYKNGEKFFTDVGFRGHTVEAPIMVDITEVYVGLFAGDLSTTTPAKIACERSILCGEGTRMMKGETGDAASVVIGEVTTVEADVPAEVENVGTKSAAVLNFKLPKGETGAKIEIGEVTQSEPGTQPQVTNTGTAAKAILNFVIPKAERDYITTVTGTSLHFFLGTQAEYDELSDEDKQGLFAVITDDRSIEEIKEVVDRLGFTEAGAFVIKTDGAVTGIVPQKKLVWSGNKTLEAGGETSLASAPIPFETGKTYEVHFHNHVVTAKFRVAGFYGKLCGANVTGTSVEEFAESETFFKIYTDRAEVKAYKRSLTDGSLTQMTQYNYDLQLKAVYEIIE